MITLFILRIKHLLALELAVLIYFHLVLQIEAADNEADPILFQKVDNNDTPEISLNQTTGSLTVALPLDRETVGSYSFEIVANDSQRSGLFLPIVTVQIVVLDINDNAPLFVNSPYSYTIEEGVSNGYQVGLLKNENGIIFNNL